MPNINDFLLKNIGIYIGCILNIAALSASVTVNVRSGDTSVLSNVKNSTSGVNKIGGGTLVIDNPHGISGNSTVSQGSLIINGSIQGNVTVNSGATLGGSGTIGGATINSGGTLAVQYNLSSASYLNITGATHVNNGSLKLMPEIPQSGSITYDFSRGNYAFTALKTEDSVNGIQGRFSNIIVPDIDKTESKYTNSKKLAINKG